MYASLKGLLAGKRPLVTAVTLASAEDGEAAVFLIRRLSLLEVLDAGAGFPQPVTRLVRAMMGQGAAPSSIGGGGLTEQESVQVAKALVTAAVIVPPDDVWTGERGPGEITRAECVPMFAAEPGDGRAVVMEYGEFDRYAADLDDHVECGDMTEDERDARLAGVVPMFYDDLIDLGDEVMATGVGQLARFRGYEAAPARSLASMGGASGQRSDDKRPVRAGVTAGARP